MPPPVETLRIAHRKRCDASVHDRSEPRARCTMELVGGVTGDDGGQLILPVLCSAHDAGSVRRHRRCNFVVFFDRSPVAER